MSKSPAICPNCPRPPEVPFVCDGPIMFVTDPVEMKDVNGNDVVRAQAVGPGIMKWMCQSAFTPQPDVLVEAPRPDGRGRYAVKVSDSLANGSEEQKQEIIRDMRADTEKRLRHPFPTRTDFKPLRSIDTTITPAIQLWAELHAISADEEVVRLANPAEKALEDAEYFIADALRTSQYLDAVMGRYRATHEALREVFVLERRFKDCLSTYLVGNAPGIDASNVPTTTSEYTSWTRTRQREPVNSSGITYLNDVARQLAHAAELIKEGGFLDLESVAMMRFNTFSSVTYGSNNDHIEAAYETSRQLVGSTVETRTKAQGLVVEIEDVIDKIL